MGDHVGYIAPGVNDRETAPGGHFFRPLLSLLIFTLSSSAEPECTPNVATPTHVTCSSRSTCSTHMYTHARITCVYARTR